MNTLDKTKKIPLKKGWSNDQKTILKSKDSTVLLRVMDASKYQRKIQEIQYLSSLDLFPIQHSQPLSVELIKCKTHFITSYIEGTDLFETLSSLPINQQIHLGLQAGYALKQIHTQIKVQNDGSWEKRYKAKIETKIKSYHECRINFEHDEILIQRIYELMPLLKDRPQAFQHGDYHVGNFVVDLDGNLGILDFDRWDIGNPWEEFNRITWCREKSTVFSSAMIEAYFDFQIPQQFFELMFLYIAVNAIGSLSWAQDFGQEEVDVALHLIDQFDQDTDHFSKIKPSWFKPTRL
ncbi:MAG: aminoglycoside phosphotransferase [Erysipelotrichaceae bacterium]|nr:MAG: aminoglycoside [Erysipelotrichaceae bacterium]TXT18881.1 MAG: aminoglycoside phosphotransferase [Erysipelotrichaceae bacterium]